MPFETASFLAPIDENTEGPNGEAPGKWNGNILIIRELCKRSDAASLKELIRSGRLVRPNGEPFLQEGEELPDDDGPYLSDPESRVLEAINGDGVLLFDNLDRPDPMPRLIKGSKNKGYTITVPLRGLDILALTEEQFGYPKEPVMPTGATVWWDKFLRFFGGKGSVAMCRYRSDLEAYRKPGQAAEKIGNMGVMASRRAAEAGRSSIQFSEALGEYNAQKTRYDKAYVPSTEGNQINELRRDAGIGHNDNYRVVTTESRIENRSKTERNLAAMVALDLILRERMAAGVQTVADGRAKSEPVTAGPLETKLNRIGYLDFINFVREEPLFKKSVEKMTHRGLGDFLIGNKGVEMVSQEILDSWKSPKTTEQSGKQNVREKTGDPMVKVKGG